MIVAARRLVVLEFEHDVTRAGRALQRLPAAAARERPPSVLGNHLRRRGGVARGSLGIDDVDARDDVALGHGGGSLRARTLSSLRERSSLPVLARNGQEWVLAAPGRR